MTRIFGPLKLFGLALSLVGHLAMADSLERISWSGFWTMGVAGTDSDLSFSNLNRKPNVYRDSLAGLNGHIAVSEDWSATLQLLATGQPNDFEPELDWALATWQPNSMYTLRLGKQKLPVWLVSDYLDVGILLPWIRPPLEVYDANPISTFVGMSHSLAFSLGSDLNGVVDFVAGSSKTEIHSDVTSSVTKGTIHDIGGVNLTLNFGAGTFRLGYLQAHIDGTTETTVDTPCTVPTCGPSAPPGTSLRTTLVSSIDLGLGTFKSAGFKWDDKKYLVMTEYALQENKDSTFLEKVGAYYATLGYYMGGEKKLLTHVTYATMTDADGTVLNGKQTTSTLGFNCYFSESLVGKLEWAQTEASEGMGKFSADPGRKVNVVGLALSAVF
ncbi:MAG: hypothetical protein KDD68_16405 [Bdellovibrionales bacterium]|nr:hypothetical protein [Bdellovibrionales bacterium]